jgi:23S rRNA pseudouridine1911/1915/1917 synthase
MVVIGAASKPDVGAEGKAANGGHGQSRHFVVGVENAAQRLDLYLAGLLPDLSRTMLGQLIKAGGVLIDGKIRKSGYRIKQAEEVTVSIPAPAALDVIPEKVDFVIVHEDDDILVVSKPPGIVVHPSHSHSQGTLVHGLLHYLDELPVIGGEHRPGIVHRLDKDTSGLLIVAKNDQSHRYLSSLFKKRQIKKTYHAVVAGRLPSAEGFVDAQIGRHPVQRKKMAVAAERGRAAVTRWRVLDEFAGPFTYVELRPETGRTHQLRVHMASLGHPIIGDRLYGRKHCRYGGLVIKRQCLHAYALSFTHPRSGKRMSFTAPVWADMQEIIDVLKGSHLQL